MTPQLYTVKARQVTDSGRVINQKTMTDLTNEQSRSTMSNLTRLGWECVRVYQ